MQIFALIPTIGIKFLQLRTSEKTKPLFRDGRRTDVIAYRGSLDDEEDDV